MRQRECELSGGGDGTTVSAEGAARIAFLERCKRMLTREKSVARRRGDWMLWIRHTYRSRQSTYLHAVQLPQPRELLLCMIKNGWT